MEIDLAELIRLWLREKRNYLIGLFSSIALVVLYCLLSPATYEGRISLVPLDTQKGRSAGILGSLSGMLPFGLDDLKGHDTQGLVNLLTSQSVRRKVVEISHLYEIYDSNFADALKNEFDRNVLIERVANRLERLTQLEVSKTGLITIKVKLTKSAAKAAEVTNAYATALNQFIEENSFSEAKKKIKFLNEQMEAAKNQISELNLSLLAYGRTSGTVNVRKEFLPVLQEASQLTKSLSHFQLESHLFKNYFNYDENSAKLMTDRIDGLKKRAHLIKPPLGWLQANPIADDSNTAVLSLANNPILGLEQILMQQELNRFMAALNLFSEQLQMAKIDEAKEGNNFQVIDPAVPYEIKIWPRPKILLALGVFAYTLAYLAYLVFRERRRGSGKKASLKPKTS